jgi:hypothetical protein
MNFNKRLIKELTPNDLGLTGSHQCGIYIPKKLSVYFPKLNKNLKNPEIFINFQGENDKQFSFRYVHYNNKLHDLIGRRNEFRLLRMREFFKINQAKSGDFISFTFSEDLNYIRYLNKATEIFNNSSAEDKWKVLNLKIKEKK